MLLVTTCTFSCRKPFKKPGKSFIKISLDENDDYVILVSSLNQFPLCYVNRCCNIQCRLSGVTCLNDFFFSKKLQQNLAHLPASCSCDFLFCLLGVFCFSLHDKIIKKISFLESYSLTSQGYFCLGKKIKSEDDAILEITGSLN